MEPSPEVVDAVIDRYVAWREQSAAVNSAYAAWSRAPVADREPAFEHYVTALDREEHAAAAYRRVIERLLTER